MVLSLRRERFSPFLCWKMFESHVVFFVASNGCGRFRSYCSALRGKIDAYFIPESGGRLSDALGYAASWCVKREAEAVLILSADVPLITERNLKEIICFSEKISVVISPSTDGGTNALMLRPLLLTFLSRRLRWDRASLCRLLLSFPILHRLPSRTAMDLSFVKPAIKPALASSQPETSNPKTENITLLFL